MATERPGRRLHERARQLVGRALGRSHADRGIGRVSAILILVAVLCTGVTSYVYLNQLVIRDWSEILESERERRAQQLILPMRTQIQMVNALSARNHTAQAMRVYQAGETGAAERTQALLTLQLTAGNLVGVGGLRAVELQSLQGDRIASAAHLPELPTLNVPLAQSRNVLYWDNGFFLRVRSEIVGEDGAAGALIADLELPDAVEALTLTNRLGETGEVGLCGLNGHRKVCLPSRFKREGSVSTVASPATLPSDRALLGGRGTEQVTDYRGHATYSSFQPLEGYGLALIVKMDVAELLAPVRQQVQVGLPLLIFLALAGAAVMRLQLRPLTAELVDARRRADAEVASRTVAEAEIRLANRRLQIVSDNASFLIAFVDPQFVFRFANRAHVEWFGRPIDDIVGRPMEELVGAAMFQDYRQAMALAQATHVPQQVLREMLREVTTRFVEVTFVAQFDGDRNLEGFCISARDATETVLREKTLLLAARRDPLTGLCNRTSFDERLEQALLLRTAASAPLAVAYLDIDHFKQVNDNFGHDVGDELLKLVASRIGAALRHSDTVARLGGDEFGIILPDLAAADDVYTVVAHILESLRQPFFIEAHQIRVSASIGFTIASLGDTRESLVSRSDRALYQVKRSGRNGVFGLSAERTVEFL
ncbi:MAG: GGDEF domain-containing protein [Lautropia sp.]|nr:GGDEF domain-containing protein [Lautropia sp.]